ncbi:MAG: hypothetical protein IKC34_01465 [Clostridia bacterium]|nr:hypothetical protein [Clostridia bacterium]
MKRKGVLREVRLAVLLLILLVITVGTSTAISQSVTNDLIESAEALYTGENCALSEDKATAIYEKFERWRFFFSITVSHDDIGLAESELLELVEAVKANDEAAASIAKSRLIGALKQLKRLSGIGPDSVI